MGVCVELCFEVLVVFVFDGDVVFVGLVFLGFLEEFCFGVDDCFVDCDGGVVVVVFVVIWCVVGSFVFGECDVCDF